MGNGYRNPLIGKCFNEGRWQQASGAVLEYTDALVATRARGVGMPKDPNTPHFHHGSPAFDSE